ncbi:MAG: hypothetical protein MJZ92_05715, partial [Paludibacteraceae bacterium]|nr:hypothetical protein [Paludibacteraceae bacterium]
MNRLCYIVFALLLCLTSCREEQFTDDPACRLAFSMDTVRFDTVFTTVGSATMQLMVRNPNANALRISRIWLDNGKYFHVNIDGENDSSYFHNVEIRGGDSLYVFLNLYIDPQASDAPVLVEDAMHFLVNENVQTIHLEAYGQNVNKIKSASHVSMFDHYTFTAERPYLIYDTLVIKDSLTLEAGARLYFHLGAAIYVEGNVSVQGTLAEPVILRGDRLDNLFDSVPYRYAAGQWGGLYLMPSAEKQNVSYRFDYVDILSGNVGIYCSNQNLTSLPRLVVHNSCIHNHPLYGLVLQNVDADVVNTEISNCASYCVYL